MTLRKRSQVYIPLRDSITQSGAQRVTEGLWQDLFERVQMEIYYIQVFPSYLYDL